MENFIRWCIAIAAQPILAFLFCFVITRGIYLIEEINHTVKGIKREIKQAWWDIEWQIKLRKGR